MINMLIQKECVKVFNHITQKYPRDITFEQLIHEFGFEFCHTESSEVSGWIDIDYKEIVYSVHNADRDKYVTVCHELGHLIQYIAEVDRFRDERFSTYLRFEREADLLAVELDTWFFPESVDYSNHYRYWKQDSVDFLKDYYDGFLDMER